MWHTVNLPKLRELVARYGPQSKAAKEIGLTQSGLSRLLKGSGLVCTNTLWALRDMLEVPEKELILRGVNPYETILVRRDKLLNAIFSKAENALEFSRMSGIPHSTLLAIVRRRRTTRKTLQKFCSCLEGYKPEDFMEVSDED